jgi:ubiquinone/menaquinone biosynthesis C-methylase UbiE
MMNQITPLTPRTHPVLKRILEPEVMDTLEEAVEYDAMDHRAVNESFVADLLAAGSLGEDLLDLGTGTALIPIQLCRQDESLRVLAVDAAEQMLNLARNNIEMDSLTDRIQLDLVDAKALAYEDDRFTTVISNSIVHHIPEPRAVLAEAIRVTIPDGQLFFRDLLRPDNDAEVERLVATYAGEENERQRQMFDDSLRAALSLEEIREIVAGFGFSAESVHATSDRHWTWSARKP